MQEARKGPPFFTEAQGQFQKDRVVELVIVRPAPITPPDRVGGPELDGDLLFCDDGELLEEVLGELDSFLGSCFVCVDDRLHFNSSWVGAGIKCHRLT